LNNAIVVLGGGPGLGCVLQALRDREHDQLTVIVSIAHEEQAREPQGDDAGHAVEDLRRSLEALTAEEGALLRAIRRPLTVGDLRKQPVGNLVLCSVAAAFGDYVMASMWLGEQLGIAGAVLPATTQPVRRELELVDQESACTARDRPGRNLQRIRFAADLKSPAWAIAAIGDGRGGGVAPRSRERSQLSNAPLPEVGFARADTPAPGGWIAKHEIGRAAGGGRVW
jgi:2-phospho-L-lactate transferase/gluconeogenesis factor (CofD/UPF0052 family)